MKHDVIKPNGKAVSMARHARLFELIRQETLQRAATGPVAADQSIFDQQAVALRRQAAGSLQKFVANMAA